MPSSPHGKWTTTMFSLAPSPTSPIASSTNTGTYLQTSNLAEAMPITSGRQAKAKAKAKERAKAKAKGSTTRAKANRTKAKAADLAATYIGTKRMFQQTNVHAPITMRVKEPRHKQRNKRASTVSHFYYSFGVRVRVRVRVGVSVMVLSL
jgi:hypothetical protein